MTLSRRHVLQRSLAFSLGFSGLHTLLRPGTAMADLLRLHAGPGYGPLVSDPAGQLDLPAGFSYKAISCFREVMDDGLTVPAKHDGMAAFPGPDGLTVLVRNHELDTADMVRGAFGSRGQRLTDAIRAKMYDTGHGSVPALGGTTTVVYDTRAKRVVRHSMSLAGTVYNCAGGMTPWGTWLSCEETMTLAGDRYSKDHGYVFEVKASAEAGLQKAEPIEAMGRFQHEAAAVDPRSNVVYMTEDLADGLLYRYIPKVPGKLHEGGRLQCLMLKGAPRADTRNWEKQTFGLGTAHAAEWFDLEHTASAQNDLRYANFERGAAVFGRGEGMWYANGVIYFATTIGGKAQRGQIWKYTPSAKEGTPLEAQSPGMLELFVEPNDGTLIGNCDNITVAPWGDLVVCEDAVPDDDKENFLLGISPEGSVYKLARNAGSSSEFAGATFSPDGSTLFVNRQNEGQTLAITGPWKS
ncbi:MAG: alkaline phosphatase PhoX [Phycisphaerales bacterium]